MAAEPEYPSEGISRRGLLALTAGGAVTLGGVAAGGLMGYSALRERFRPWYDRASGTGTLKSRDAEIILALVEVLVPARYRRSGARTRELVDTATEQTPGVFKEYTAAAEFLQRLSLETAGMGFAQLPPETRDHLLRQLLWRYPADPGTRNHLTTRLEFVLRGEDAGRLRQLVIRDILTRFYVDVQERVLGYHNLPGVPGDPRSYVSAPATRMPERGQ